MNLKKGQILILKKDSIEDINNIEYIIEYIL
jgi:hypothetical protein